MNSTLEARSCTVVLFCSFEVNRGRYSEFDQFILKGF